MIWIVLFGMPGRIRSRGIGQGAQDFSIFDPHTNALPGSEPSEPELLLNVPGLSYSVVMCLELEVIGKHGITQKTSLTEGDVRRKEDMLCLSLGSKFRRQKRFERESSIGCTLTSAGSIIFGRMRI